MRTGFASPNIEPDAFTDVDRTVAVGAVLFWQAMGTAGRCLGGRWYYQQHI